MVEAIWGRMPLMMQSAPIRRAAVMVLSRCCATSVSTVGTPVMSMIATLAPVSTIRWSSDSITTWVRALSRVPIIGSASTPSHSFTTGVESSSISSCCRRMTLLPPLLVHLGGIQAQPVDQRGWCARLLEQSLGRAAVPPELLEHGLLEREHEHRGLGGTESLHRPAGGNAAQEIPHRGPGGPLDIHLAGLGRLAHQPQELAGLFPQLGVGHESALVSDGGELLLDPALEDGTLVLGEKLGKTGSRGGGHDDSRETG